MNYKFLAETKIFNGISEIEIEGMLKCLRSYTKAYEKGEYIFYAGENISAMGLVLAGSVNVESLDVWGNNSILDNIGMGQVFAETYACVLQEPLMVNVTAAEDCQILFLKMDKLLTICCIACEFHNRLISNLLTVMASKNLNLTRKINHTAPKSIRGRLLSYLSFQATKQGTYCFEIPYNRQQLADYLGVDRSAMSNELSKMQKEGILSFHKSKFCLNQISRNF